MSELTLLTSPDWQDYELLDSGGRAKLERYGPYTFVRPEHQAIWKPALSQEHWQAAHAIFEPSGGESGGHWEFTQSIPTSWDMRYKSLKFRAHATASRHMGVFPEQANHWDWIGDRIQKAGRPTRVLNLFGYTGLATLAASQAGAHVTHVDASKRAIKQARRNQVLSGLSERPIRWLVDDAWKFVRRESRRGSQYEGLILDPPKFGRGPKGRVWQFLDSLPELLTDCRKILSDQPLFIVLTAYAVSVSAPSLANTFGEICTDLEGDISMGELVLVERSAGRRLSKALFVRWAKN